MHGYEVTPCYLVEDGQNLSEALVVWHCYTWEGSPLVGMCVDRRMKAGQIHPGCHAASPCHN